MRRRSHLVALSVVTAALWGLLAQPCAADQGRAAAAPAAAATAAVPEWLAWKAFHESLSFYAQQSPAEVNALLVKTVGLADVDAAVVLSAGQAYVAVIDQIDSEAKTEVQRRYGSGRGAPPNIARTAGSAPPASDPVVLRRGKSMRDMVVEDGLYAQVEARKQAAVNAHLVDVTRTLGRAKLAQLAQFVNTSVAPRVKTATTGTPVADIDRSSRGNVFVPRPSIKR